MYISDVLVRQKIKYTQWGALRSIHWFLRKVTVDIRCASKGIRWCQTSSICFSNRIRQGRFDI